MNLLHTSHLEVVRFLYQFKDDNKYYKIGKNVLQAKSHEESHSLIYTLRDNAFIGTDREIHNNPAKSKGDSDEIGVKILPKGIVAIERLLKDN